MSPLSSESLEQHGRKRGRALVYFWISLAVLITTPLLSYLRLQELSGRAAGGVGGFVVLREYAKVWLLTLVGLASLVFAVLSIPGYRGGIVLFVVELLVLLGFLLSLGTVHVS